MKKIEAHNSKESSYTMGVNQFTDLTWEEFKEAYLAKATPNPKNNSNGEYIRDLKEIDWRKEKIVTRVKN